MLITGGSRGLGFALAAEYLRRGSRVAIVARDARELEAAARRLEKLGDIHTYVCDLTHTETFPALVQQVTAELGDIDVLVNNAGIIQVGPSQQLLDEDFRDAMNLHFWAPLLLTRAVLPRMLRRNEGRIVNISSIGGLIAVPHLLPYSASKFALTGLTEGWHAELKQHGIRVTLVCPWLMRTGSQERVLLRGDTRREYAWFAASGATPLSAQSAGAAARKIVEASQRGRAHLVLALPGKLAALAHGIAPGAVMRMMSWSNRLLPDSAAESAGSSGAEAYNSWTRKLLRPWIRHAGQRWNQSAA